MKPRNDCPTCGTPLGPLHADAIRTCSACHRPNPRGFRYCGFCAAPMTTEAQKAERADVAAPAGGWPNLSRELVELRFFMDRGELDEAFELLTILRDRYPGHPALDDFERSPEAKKPRPDTQVNRVVDSVLAGSQSLNSAMPRRSVPQWKAGKVGDQAEPESPRPTAGSATRAHATVPLGSSTQAPAVRKRVVRAGDTPPAPKGYGVPLPKTPRATTARHLGAVPLDSTKSGGSAAGDSGPDAITKPEPIAPMDSSQAGSRAGMTVAVPTLQAPAPYQGGDVPRANKAAQSVVRKRALKSRKRTGRQALVDSRQDEENPRRRLRGDSFGQHVLGRMGRKKKPKP